MGTPGVQQFGGTWLIEVPGRETGKLCDEIWNTFRSHGVGKPGFSMAHGFPELLRGYTVPSGEPEKDTAGGLAGER